MNKENFIEYIKTLQKIEETQSKMMGSGVCLIDYNENFFVAMDYLMKSLFDSHEIDLINDFVWTQKEITIYTAKTKKVLFVINSPESLLDYFNSVRKKGKQIL